MGHNSVAECPLTEQWINPFWWTYRAISYSSQHSINSVTRRKEGKKEGNVFICIISQTGWHIPWPLLQCCGALAGTRSSSMCPPWRIDPTTHHPMSKRSYHRATVLERLWYILSFLWDGAPKWSLAANHIEYSPWSGRCRYSLIIWVVLNHMSDAKKTINKMFWVPLFTHTVQWEDNYRCRCQDTFYFLPLTFIIIWCWACFIYN